MSNRDKVKISKGKMKDKKNDTHREPMQPPIFPDKKGSKADY